MYCDDSTPTLNKNNEDTSANVLSAHRDVSLGTNCCKHQVESQNGGQQERRQGEQNCANEQLVERVSTWLDAVTNHVPLLSPENIEEGAHCTRVKAEDGRCHAVEKVKV